MAAPRDPAAPRRARVGQRPFAALAAACALTLTGCITGERPSFEDGPARSMTGRSEIDDVLRRLDSTPVARFTAEYDVLTKLGQIDSKATVVQAEDSRRSITINQVRYLYDGATLATCNLADGRCEATINDARTSDVLLTHEFYALAFATRLRVDAQRRIGDPEGFEMTFGAMSALCVDVPVTGGTKRYCALESGPLAFYDGNDVTIELTGYESVPDESKFATSSP